MATKLKLGLSKEARDREQTERDIELEREIQKRVNERDRKISIFLANQKRKRKIVAGVLIVVTAGLIIFGTYNTFFKPAPSKDEFAAYTMRVMGESHFNTSGVEAFLKETAATLFKDKASTTSDTDLAELDPASINITMMYKKGNDVANVFFTADVLTKKRDGQQGQPGESSKVTHSFFIPVYFKAETLSYAPAGDLQIYAVTTENSSKGEENPTMSFKELKSAGDTEVASAKLFMNNFLTAIHDGQDVRQFIDTNDKFDTRGLAFDGIQDFKLYSEDNPSGYNATCTYSVSSPEGMVFANTLYVKLKPQGKAWIIEKFL